MSSTSSDSDYSLPELEYIDQPVRPTSPGFQSPRFLPPSAVHVGYSNAEPPTASRFVQPDAAQSGASADHATANNRRYSATTLPFLAVPRRTNDNVVLRWTNNEGSGEPFTVALPLLALQRRTNDDVVLRWTNNGVGWHGTNDELNEAEQLDVVSSLDYMQCGRQTRRGALRR